MFRFKITAAAVGAAAVLLLAGCAGTPQSSSSPEAGASGGTLKLGASVAPETFDPSEAIWAGRAPYLQAVYDTLIRITPDGKLLPMLATKWKYNSAKTELTLTIHKGIHFTDGTNLTSEVVAENLRRFQKNNTGPDSQALANAKSIETPNASTVVLTLDAPDPDLLFDLGQDAGLVASGKSLTAKDISTNPVGSGPYLLDTKTTVTGSEYVFTKNPKYWDKTLQHYDNIDIYVYSAPSATLNALKSGAINAVGITDFTSVPQVKAAGWTINTGAGAESMGLLLLDRGGKLNNAIANVKVRQAINTALNRPALLKVVAEGLGVVTEQPLPSGAPGFDKSLNKTYAYNPAKAKALLAQAGYPNGFTLQMPQTAANLGPSFFNLISQELKDIGITVKFTNYATWGDYATAMFAPKYSVDLTPVPLMSDWTFAQSFISPAGGLNPFHTSDTTLNALTEKIRVGDAAASKKMNEYLVDQAWFAPIYVPDNVIATDPHTNVVMPSSTVVAGIYIYSPKS